MKRTYIFASIALSVLLLIGLTVGLVAGGVIGGGTPKLVFQSASAEAVYNGAPLLAGEWSLVEGKLQDGHTARATILGTQTDVGQSANLFSVVVYDENGADVSSDYVLECVPGVLTVTPLPIELLADSASKQYDGKPLSCATYKINKGNLVEGHSLQVSMETKRVEVGQSPNTLTAYVFDANKKDVTQNYSINCVAGDLTVISNAITVQSGNQEKIYDGTPLTLEDAHLTAGTLMEGHVLSVVHTGTLTDAGKVPNTFAVVIHDARGNNITQNYAITTVFGELSILKRSVTVRTHGDSKDYDGTPLTCATWEVVSQTNVLDGHTLQVIVSGTRTEVGESPNTVAEYIVTDKEGNDVTKNYDFSGEELGSLVINDALAPDGRRPLTVTAGSAQKFYDGQPLTEDSYTLTVPGENVGLRDGDTIEVVIEGSRTEEGTTPNLVSSVVVRDGAGLDVTDLYSIQKINGTLTVLLRPITVTSGDAEKAYDGTPLTNSKYTYTQANESEGLYDGHTIDVTVTGTITDVGTTPNVISTVVIKDAEGADKTAWYNVTKKEGTLTVYLRSVTVTANSAKKVYDGTPLEDSGFTKSIEGNDQGLLEGHTVTATVTGSITDVGKTENVISNIVIKDAGGNDVTSTYKIIPVNGILEILPADASNNTGAQGGSSGASGDIGLPEGSTGGDPNQVILRVKSSLNDMVYMREFSFGDYTGQGWLPATTYDITVNGPYSMNYLTGLALAKAGLRSTEMEIEYVAGYYMLPYYLAMDEADYRIQSSDVIFMGDTAASSSVPYYVFDYRTSAIPLNGLPEEYKKAEEQYRSFVYEKYLQIPDSTKAYMLQVIDEKGFSSADANVLGAVASYIRGAAMYDLDYDRELDNEADIAVAFLSQYHRGICQHYATAATMLLRALGIPARYTVGYVGQTVSGDWSEITGDKAHAWVEAYVDGVGWVQLEVTGSSDAPRTEITVVAESAQKYYDGQPLTKDGYIFDETQLPDGYTYTITATVEGSITEVGVQNNCITDCVMQIYDAHGNEVTYLYEVVLLDGLLTVLKRPLTVTANSAEKVYDGTPLEDSGFTYNTPESDTDGTGLLEGHTVEATVMGSITEIGTAPNVLFDIVIKDADDNDVTEQYEIEKIEGALTVTKRSLTLTANSDEKIYDGTPLENAGYKLQGSVLEQHTLEVMITGSITNVGTEANVVASFVIKDAMQVDVTYKYKVDTISGTLKIRPRPIVLKANNDEKIYDGEPLENDGFSTNATDKGVGLVEGHTATATVTGSITQVGETDNVISDVVITDAQGIVVTDNYAIALENGILRILPSDETEDGEGDPGDGEEGGEGDSGEGEGSGGGGSNGLSESGDLRGGDCDNPESKKTVVLRVYAAQKGSAYLRLKSFGSYTGKGWSDATAYSDLLGNVYSMDYLIGTALANAGFAALEMKIETSTGQYFLPYYLAPNGNSSKIQTSDVRFDGSTDNIYSVSYYVYDYNGTASLLAQLPVEYKDAEQAYRTFVHENYLDVTGSTLDLMNDIIAKENFKADDPDIILKVARYIQNAAEYDTKYDAAMDEEADIVAAFLTEYKTGLCRHYASAATLLYRALGIPARYTIGYSANTLENEWSEVTADRAHAWVEVYLDGFGWVQVEVTGVSDGSDDDNEKEDEENLHPLTIKPETLYMKYDGSSKLDASVAEPKLIGTELDRLLERGYTYTASFEGVRSQVGYGKSRIVDFVLYDPEGNDVTSQHDIKKEEGTLHVYLEEITVESHDMSQLYDGSTLRPDADDYAFTGNMVDSTHRLVVTFLASQTNAGKTTNRFKVAVLDENDNNVNYMYKINSKAGTLKVEHRKLVITADSAQKAYDGEPLTASYQIEGDLCDGHEITVTVFGSQTEPGRSSNVIASVQILDENGEDVTHNYAINRNSGVLRVT